MFLLIGDLVAKYLTLCDPIDCSLPGSSVHGIFQARILEWVAISSSRASSPPRDQTWVFCIAGRFFTNWATREAHVNFMKCRRQHLTLKHFKNYGAMLCIVQLYNIYYTVQFEKSKRILRWKWKCTKKKCDILV